MKAVFSIAPALGPAILPESLASIGVPVELVAGFGDPGLPVAENVMPDALTIANAQLTVWPNRSVITSRVPVHRATAELALTFFARTIGR